MQTAMAFVTVTRLSVARMRQLATTMVLQQMLVIAFTPTATVKYATATAASLFWMKMVMAFVMVTRSSVVRTLQLVTTMLQQQMLVIVFTLMATAKSATATAA
jgi:hypothetical protein